MWFTIAVDAIIHACKYLISRYKIPVGVMFFVALAFAFALLLNIQTNHQMKLENEQTNRQMKSENEETNRQIQSLTSNMVNTNEQVKILVEAIHINQIQNAKQDQENINLINAVAELKQDVKELNRSTHSLDTRVSVLEKHR